jgi:hypothetical protein
VECVRYLQDQDRGRPLRPLPPGPQGGPPHGLLHAAPVGLVHGPVPPGRPGRRRQGRAAGGPGGLPRGHAEVPGHAGPGRGRLARRLGGRPAPGVGGPPEPARPPQEGQLRRDRPAHRRVRQVGRHAPGPVRGQGPVHPRVRQAGRRAVQGPHPVLGGLERAQLRRQARGVRRAPAATLRDPQGLRPGGPGPRPGRLRHPTALV